MKQTIKFFAILAVVFTMVSCDDDDENETPVVETVVEFETTLSGANQVPANESSATGSAILSFDTETKIFLLKVEHGIAETTMGHVHKGAVGENGSVVFPLADNGASPQSFTSEPLTEEQEADLFNGLYYVNIHTEEFPDGEIRGNLIQITK